MANEQTTGTPDPHYNLISVLYHAVHGAWNYDQYIRDAQDAGDEDLAGFLRQVQDENARRAEQAKQLLKGRIE